MNTAETIARILDDYAAVNDHFRIELMGTRAMRKAVRAERESLHAIVWRRVSAACSFRAYAVRARIDGRIEQALKHEEKSERELRIVYDVTRGRH